MKAFYLLAAAVLLALGPGCSAKRATETPLSQTDVIEANGVRLFTRSVGQGTPILVVHGGPGLDHSYFFPQMNGLAQDHRLIFFDQRCSGKSQSDLGPEQMRLANFIDDIEAVREHYGLEKVHLLGHSFGGLLAMEYALAHPERIQSLVLSNSQGASSSSRTEENARLARRTDEVYQEKMEAIRSSDEFLAGESSAYEDFFRHLFSIEFYDPSLAQELTVTLPDNFVDNSTHLQYLYLDLASYDFHDELERVKAPTLLIYGDYEPLADLVAPDLERSFPDATLEVIPHCGHFPFIEQPATYFDLIRNFVAASLE